MKKQTTEEQMEVKRFIFVLLGLVIILVGVYFFTRAFVTKDLTKQTSEVNYTEGQVNYNVAVVGTMLNRPADEYYVAAFSSSDNDMAYYNTLISKYTNKEKTLPVYYLDTDNALNKDYVAKEEDASTAFTTLEELKLGKFTLLRVKNGKVTKYLTSEDKIKQEFDIE